jgi:hypothetical protein
VSAVGFPRLSSGALEIATHDKRIENKVRDRSALIQRWLLVEYSLLIVIRIEERSMIKPATDWNKDTADLAFKMPCLRSSAFSE